MGASEVELKACLELSVFLWSEIYPTLTNGERADGYNLDNVRFQLIVNERIKIVANHCSFLSGLLLKVDEGAVGGVSETIATFANHIERLLRNAEGIWEWW